ncbi:2'-5' RNA ligase family protein [Solihabitans fulvus]|uniref:2'-5' RNA ligase family protein n=1 Tax=Solihabitans fulvus TaxID=1892852 RepID=A0A5B2WWH5_9PSEU|nr:2'-5' RNA ligase family protein [Solihabitans fulvus]KAA2255220.1 2'-5' RNA ligase family protein [Solihabitans fulvus]
MPRQGQSGVVIPVPAAAPLLADIGGRYPGAVRAIPAHVSVLYPFVDAAHLDGDALGDLAAIFAGCAPTDVEFLTCQRDAGFVYLPPVDRGSIGAAISAVRARWPEVLPYGGAYGEPEPHLTVAMGVADDVAARIQRDVSARLPLRAAIDEAWLVAFTGEWQVLRRFPFGG